ncbi:MAG: InlB B-repeat-containing protein [Chloroflexota bacterium]
MNVCPIKAATTRAALLSALTLCACLLLGALPAVALGSGPLYWRSPLLIDPEPQYEGHLEGLSCPSTSLCVSADNSGHVLTSTEPTGGTGAWSTAHISGAGFWALSCPSSSFCAGAGGGNVITSTNPTGGAVAWTVTSVDPSFPAILGISCASSSLCVAVDESGHILSSTNPTGGAGEWQSVQPNGLTRLYDVSCPSASFCAAVDSAGDVLTSTEPTGEASAWTITSVEPADELFGVSCTSASFCVAAGDEGTVATSTNPTGGAAAWSVVHIGSDETLGGALGRVSCFSTSLCSIANFGGNIAMSNNPTGGAAAWTVTNVDGTTPILSMSCPSASLCLGGDGVGYLLVGTDTPTVQHTLTVAKSGSGAGTVSSAPGGIECGALCSHAFDQGATVTLTATPEPGSTFAGWSGGGCSGDGSCEVVINADTTVTASFTATEAGGESAENNTGSSSNESATVGGVAVAARQATVKHGAALLAVRCPGTAPCKGVIKLIARVKQRGAQTSRRQSHKRSINVVIGRSGYRVAAGHHATVGIRLNHRGRALIGHAGRHGLKVRLVGGGIKTRALVLKQEHRGR